MRKVVEVKACCWVCKHYYIDWNKELDLCEIFGYDFGHPLHYVCEHFEVDEQLEVRECDKYD